MSLWKAVGVAMEWGAELRIFPNVITVFSVKGVQ